MGHTPRIAYNAAFPFFAFLRVVSLFANFSVLEADSLRYIFATMPADITDSTIGVAHDPSVIIPADEKHELDPEAHAVAPPAVVAGKAVESNPGYFYSQGDADEDGHVGQPGDEWPTNEDLHTLRRVPDKISVSAYTVAFIELCERFSYYGTQVLCTPLRISTHV